MRNVCLALFAAIGFTILVTASRALAGPASFDFSTGNPDGLIATASRPPSAGKIETETADDFILAQQTKLESASFRGFSCSRLGWLMNCHSSRVSSSSMVRQRTVAPIATGGSIAASLCL